MAVEEEGKSRKGPRQQEGAGEHSLDEMARGLASGTISRRRLLWWACAAAIASLFPFIPRMAPAQDGGAVAKAGGAVASAGRGGAVAKAGGTVAQVPPVREPTSREECNRLVCDDVLGPCAEPPLERSCMECRDECARRFPKG